jgi:xanthosine phosphorylase
MFSLCHKKPNPDRDIEQSAKMIRSLLGTMRPKIAVILGSGLGLLADRVSGAIEIPYTVLPGFPRPGVQGHDGKLVAGTIDGVPVIFLKGRAHLYEGIDFTTMKVCIRTLRAIGIEVLFVTNSVGSLSEKIQPGSIVAIEDHINLSGTNPLVGHNDEHWGPRFPPMNDAWDPALRKILLDAAAAIDIPMFSGVYVGLLGPTFETPAEIRFLQKIGADCVGMSTVADCIIARHCGMKVVGCNTVVNLAAGLSDVAPSHEETLKWGASTGEEKLSHVIIRFLRDWHEAQGRA